MIEKTLLFIQECQLPYLLFSLETCILFFILGCRFAMYNTTCTYNDKQIQAFLSQLEWRVILSSELGLSILNLDNLQFLS